MTELKPCPFCGGRDIDPDNWADGPCGAMHGGHACVTCGAAPGKIGTDVWNTRPVEDALHDEVERLRLVRVAADDMIDVVDNMYMTSEMVNIIYALEGALIVAGFREDDGSERTRRKVEAYNRALRVAEGE